MKRTLATTMLALACLRAGAGAGSPDMPAPLRCHELPWSTDMSSTRAVSRAYAGSPRLFYALRKDDTALLKSELDAGDDPDVCAHDAGILAHAAALGDIDAVEVLLAHGAGVDRVRREDGATPLFDALMMGHFDVATLLLVHGADPLLTTDAGGTVLMNLAKFQLPAAEEAAQLELAAEFVRRGVPVNAQAGAARRTALMSAALDDNRAYVRFLLAHGADPSLQDMRQRTAAHAAATAHDPDLAALLNAAAQHHDHQDDQP
jgi:ankyrin repeat protein